jgi:hypothetical protein
MISIVIIYIYQNSHISAQYRQKQAQDTIATFLPAMPKSLPTRLYDMILKYLRHIYEVVEISARTLRLLRL